MFHRRLTIKATVYNSFHSIGFIVNNAVLCKSVDPIIAYAMDSVNRLILLQRIPLRTA